MVNVGKSVVEEREEMVFARRKASRGDPRKVEEIDIAACKKISIETSRQRNTWSVKFASDLLPTKKNMLKRRHSTENVCPSCGVANEKSEHPFQCRGTEMKRSFSESMDDIKSFLHFTTSAENSKLSLSPWTTSAVRERCRLIKLPKLCMRF